MRLSLSHLQANQKGTCRLAQLIVDDTRRDRRVEIDRVLYNMHSIGLVHHIAKLPPREQLREVHFDGEAKCVRIRCAKPQERCELLACLGFLRREFRRVPLASTPRAISDRLELVGCERLEIGRASCRERVYSSV